MAGFVKTRGTFDGGDVIKGSDVAAIEIQVLLQKDQQKVLQAI